MRRLYLGGGSDALFLAAHVPAGDLWRYLRHQYAGMAELALKQAIEQQYLDWLPMVLAAGYDDCALLNQVCACAAPGNMPFMGCGQDLVTHLSLGSVDDDLIHSRMYYCQSADYDTKAKPNLVQTIDMNVLKAAWPEWFEETIDQWPYWQLLEQLNFPHGNTGLWTALMVQDRAKLLETTLRLHPRELLEAVSVYRPLATICADLGLAVTYDPAGMILQGVSLQTLVNYLHVNHGTVATNALARFGQDHGFKLSGVMFKGFGECDLKQVVKNNWPNLQQDSVLVYTFMTEHYWMRGVRKIYLNREDDFNHQFSYLYPTLVADLLENWHLPLTDFMQRVQTYYGQATRQRLDADSVVTRQSLRVAEWHLYGSSRLGIYKTQDTLRTVDLSLVYQLSNINIAPTQTLSKKEFYSFDSTYTHKRGDKLYEGSNHLGNVLVTFSDKRIATCTESQVHYQADVRSATDYAAFGALLDDRQWYSGLDSGVYRYGFNRMEKDDEAKGVGNSYDFGARIYDSRIGRWLSLDFLEQFCSPYITCNDNPIRHADIDGNWVPSVTPNGKIILTAEKGDNYNTLKDFFTSEEIAKKFIDEKVLRALSSNPQKNVPEGAFYYFTKNNLFSETLNDAKEEDDMAWGLEDRDNLRKQGRRGDSYNCFYMVKALIEKGTIKGWRALKRTTNGETYGPSMDDVEFRKWISRKTINSTENDAKFGQTIITFGNYHAAIFFGKDINGDSYAFTKNGDLLASTIMKVKDFDANTKGFIPDYGGGNYGVPREMPPNEELSHPKLVKGGWYDPIQ